MFNSVVSVLQNRIPHFEILIFKLYFNSISQQTQKILQQANAGVYFLFHWCIPVVETFILRHVGVRNSSHTSQGRDLQEAGSIASV